MPETVKLRRRLSNFFTHMNTQISLLKLFLHMVSIYVNVS